MSVLILFETVEGHTAKVADFAADVAREAGRTVEVIDLGGKEEPAFGGVDHVILAASVHQRRHPRDFEATVAAHREVLSRLPVLMLSVSLSAAFPEGRDEAQDYLDEMKMRTGLAPNAEALVPGAVQTAKYDYFAMQVVKFVLLRGRQVDSDAAEHVFTDWEALRTTVQDFLAAR